MSNESHASFQNSVLEKIKSNLLRVGNPLSVVIATHVGYGCVVQAEPNDHLCICTHRCGVVDISYVDSVSVVEAV